MWVGGLRFRCGRLAARSAIGAARCRCILLRLAAFAFVFGLAFLVEFALPLLEGVGVSSHQCSLNYGSSEGRVVSALRTSAKRICVHKHRLADARAIADRTLGISFATIGERAV